jgi:hypothetical protein
MNRPVRWVVLLTAAGVLAGGVFGYLVARTIGCVVDGLGIPTSGTCYRVLGSYVSGTTYYTAAAALIGAGIGLALALFVATPILLRRSRDRDTRMHPLEHPVTWFGLQLLELLIVVPELLFWVPDPGVWPEAARIAVFVLVLTGLMAVNYAIRRQFIPH